MKLFPALFAFCFLLFAFCFLKTPSSFAQTLPYQNPQPQAIQSYAAPSTNQDVPPRNPATTGNVVGTFQPQADYVPNNL
ncbi:MAG: hypothetical protein AAB675_00745, partial [Patescibacteria group bacterium]